MIDLLLGIVFFNVLLILFKLFERYKVDNLQAIIVNYAVAGALGVFFYEKDLSFEQIFEFDWIYYAILIGLFFISVFKLLADGAQKVGLAIATIANKMSVIFPVIASFILYGDRVTFYKILGLIIALIGVVMSSSENGKLSFNKKYIWLIGFIFVGQGIADILFNYAQQTYVKSDEAPLYISVIFISAFVIGTFILGARLLQKKEVFKVKNIIWGIALGIPNYLTVFFFFNALESPLMDSSEVYPILNMGVIILSALSGLLLFKERLALSNWVGIILCVVAIGLISLERIFS